MHKLAVKYLIHCTGVLVISLLCLPTLAVAQVCYRAVEVQNLASYLEQLNWNTSHLNESEIRYLDSRINAVETSNVIPKLSQNGRIQETRSILMLLATSRQISADGTILDRSQLQKQLARVRAVIADACSGHLGLSETSVKHTQFRSNGPAGLLLALYNNANIYLRTVIFLLTMVSVIGAVVITRVAYNRVYAMIYCRKSCVVKAEIDFGAEAIKGHITLIGKKGCRFKPSDNADLERVKDLIGPKRPRLVVLGLSVLLIPNAVTPTFISCFFVAPISFTALSGILEESITTPHYAPKVITPPNLGNLTRGSGAQTRLG